jgi:hypothetical protein
MVIRFLTVGSIFYFNFSSPSGIAACTHLHAICGFRRQYCSRRSNSYKFTVFSYFHNFSSLFRDIQRIVSCNIDIKNLCYLFAFFIFRSKTYQIPFSYRRQNRNIGEMIAAIANLPAACKRVADCL